MSNAVSGNPMNRIPSRFSSPSPTFVTRTHSADTLSPVAHSSYRYYKESQKILGNTYGMCVLQDFEAITPNLLARTIETVEGGGLVVLLLKTMTSLKQLYTMTMVCIVPSHGTLSDTFLLTIRTSMPATAPPRTTP